MLGKLRSLFAQSFFYTVGNFITKASGLIIIPLYAMYVSKAEFGLLTMYETVFMFMQAISGWGVKGGFARWYNDMKTGQEKRSLFFTTYSFNVFTSTLGVVMSAVVLYQLNLFDGADNVRLILLFSSSSLLKLLFDVPFIQLKLQQKAFKQTIYVSVNVGLTVLFTIYFLEIKEAGIEGVFMAQLCANALTLLSVVPIIIKNCYWRFQTKVLGEMIQYGYPLAISTVLTIVLTFSDRYILEAFYSLEDVGSFSVAIKVANLLQFLVVSSFVTSYTYQYYKSMNEEQGGRYHIKIFTYFVLFLVLAGLGIVYFGKEIVYIIMAGKAEYFDAIPVIPLLVVGLIFNGMRQVFVLPLIKAKKTRMISYIMILTGVLNVGLNLLIIPVYGKIGAAFTTSISHLFAAIWFLVKVRQVEDLNYEWRKVGLVLLIGSIFCGLYFYLPSFYWWVDIIIKLFILLGFVLSLFVLGFFEHIEKQRMREAWAKWRNPIHLKRNISSKSKSSR